MLEHQIMYKVPNYRTHIPTRCADKTSVPNSNTHTHHTYICTQTHTQTLLSHFATANAQRNSLHQPASSINIWRSNIHIYIQHESMCVRRHTADIHIRSYVYYMAHVYACTRTIHTRRLLVSPRTAVFTSLARRSAFYFGSYFGRASQN